MRPAAWLLVLVAGVTLGGCSLIAPPAAPMAPVVESTIEEPSLPSIGPDTVQVNVLARNIQFMPRAMTLPAHMPIRIVLVNADRGTPHNLTLSSAGEAILQSDIIVGPSQVGYVLQGLDPGRYRYTCVIHANMAGTITVPTP